MISKDRKINNDSSHIKDVLRKHIREMEDPGWLHCLDSNLNLPSEWDTAEYRVLFVFMSTAESRSVSSTDNVLNNLVKTKYGNRVFVDMCYLPAKGDLPLYEKYQLPVMIGAVAQRSAWDYDVIMFSNSTVEEKINLPWLVHHTGMPVWHTERMNPENEKVPLLLLGGNSSDMSEVFLGEAEDGSGNRALIDGIMVGYAEPQINEVLHILMMGKKGGYTKDIILKQLLKDFESFHHPMQFSYQYAENGWHIKEITVNPILGPETRDYVKYARDDNLNKYPGFERKILHPAMNSNYRSVDLQISAGCSSGGSCSFCKEGHVAGGWREKSIEKLTQEVHDAKMYSMADGVSWFSFNSNYMKEYMKMIQLAGENFPSLSFIAMRADVIGARPDYFDLNKKLGMSRITLGVEGVSLRLRNGYLNKNLSPDELREAVKTCLANRFLEVKLFFISTGLETKEDFDEMLELMDEFLAMRRDMGANTSFRVSVTPLCYYPETPMQWEERLTIRQIMAGEKNWKYVIDGLRERGIRFRFSSKGMQSVFAQTLLDFHRRMTPILVDLAINRNYLYYRYISNKDIQLLMEEVEKRGLKMDDMCKERPENFIFPGDYISTLKKSYLKKAMKSMRNFEPLPYCLATPAKPNNRKCVGCGYCTSKEMVESRTHREYDTTTKVDEVLFAVASNKPTTKLLVKLEKLEEYAHLNPLSTWRYLWARIFREMGVEKALKVHNVSNHYERFLNKDGVANYISGVMLAEVGMKEEVSVEEIKIAYEKVKDEILTQRLIDVRKIPLDYSLSRDAMQIVILRAVDQDMSIRDRVLTYDGTIKIIEKKMGVGAAFKEVHIDGVPDPLYYEGDVRSGSFIVASIPMYVNPYAYISSVTGVPYKKALVKYRAHRVSYFRNAMQTCKKCGGRAMMDCFTFKIQPICETCMRRVIIMKLKGRKQ